jgi:hypothetical protein
MEVITILDTEAANCNQYLFYVCSSEQSLALHARAPADKARWTLKSAAKWKLQGVLVEMKLRILAGKDG